MRTENTENIMSFSDGAISYGMSLSFSVTRNDLRLKNRKFGINILS